VIHHEQGLAYIQLNSILHAQSDHIVFYKGRFTINQSITFICQCKNYTWRVRRKVNAHAGRPVWRGAVVLVPDRGGTALR